MKGLGHTVRRHALALGLSLVLGVTACGSGKGGAAPAPTATSPGAADGPVSTGPSPREWLVKLYADGPSLYLTSHSCPGQVAAGRCTIPGDVHFWSEKAFPLRLWRYADGGWHDLGPPGVFSYADLKVQRGRLVFVPRTGYGESSTGPLRVSLDAGRTWIDWQIPQQRSRCRSGFSGPGSGPCTVALAGDLVVVASNYGWIRRDVRSGGWVDITPPKRARLGDNDEGGYGLLALGDGTLVATASAFGDAGPNGYYLVSKDGGSTWSSPHQNPGARSTLDVVDGSVVYATCGSSPGCGGYRSADLEHWRKATAAEVAILNDGEPIACRRALQGANRRWTEYALRIGPVVYAIASVPYVAGHEATSKDLPTFNRSYRSSHLLERSADGCRTWGPVTNGTS
jgi:hypothetical protein